MASAADARELRGSLQCLGGCGAFSPRKGITLALLSWLLFLLFTLFQVFFLLFTLFQVFIFSVIYYVLCLLIIIYYLLIK